jgi:hypothetical protein
LSCSHRVTASSDIQPQRGLLAVLTASALFGRANNDLLDTSKMAGECLTAGMLAPRLIVSLVRRLFLFVFPWRCNRLPPPSAATSSLVTPGSRSSSSSCKSLSVSLRLPCFAIRSSRRRSSGDRIFISASASAWSLYASCRCNCALISRRRASECAGISGCVGLLTMLL